MKHADRPTEMLVRQMQANRIAARNRKHFCHLPRFRSAFVKDILAIRKVLRERQANRNP